MAKIYNLDNPEALPPLPVEIVKGILYKPMITTIWGRPESGKSHIVIDMACTVSQKHPILYIPAEAPYEIRARGVAWKTYYETDLKNNFNVWSEPLLLMEKKEVDLFIAAATVLKPTVVFIDPLTQCFPGGNENETKDMAIVTYHLNYICRTLNCALCLVAHTGWEDAHERGSSVLRGANRLSLKASKEGDKVKLEMIKKNAGNFIESKYFNIIQVSNDEMETVLVPVDTKEDLNTVSEKHKQVIVALDLSTFSNGVSKTEINKYLADAYGIPNPSAYRYISQLMDKDWITKKGSSLIVITDEGRTMAEIFKAEKLEGKKGKIITQNYNWIISDPTQLSADSLSLSPDYQSINSSDSQIITPKPPYKGVGDKNDNNNPEKKIIN